MIRISDPARLGQILGTLRVTNGWTRRGLAREIAALSGRTENTVNQQLWEWDNGHTRPDPGSLRFYLAALGYDLALIPRAEAEPQPCTEETHSWQHFTAEQADSYWIRCTLQGPHDEHKDANTGLTWRSAEEGA